LEPSKILVNQNCDLKICDFGLAQAHKPWPTACGSTIYYRAPEILLSRQSYDTQIDVWSAGCVLAELLLGKPLFPGENSIHQLHTITKLLGSPPGDILSEKTTENVCTVQFLAAKATDRSNITDKDDQRASSDKTSLQTPNLSIQSFPKSEGKAMSAVFQGVDPLGMFLSAIEGVLY
jgi:serine/threonine protein kinase